MRARTKRLVFWDGERGETIDYDAVAELQRQEREAVVQGVERDCGSAHLPPVVTNWCIQRHRYCRPPHLL